MTEVSKAALPPVADVAAWLRQNALPVVNLQAGHGFDDLQPLKKALAGVRLVGLGEATHGTREFFQFKHRLVEFLATEMGFTVFAIEASYPACVRINDYVLYGQGDPAAALAGQGFWTWDTEEVTDMIEWMRQYNLAQPECRKLRFFGYDVQNVSLAIDLVQAYVSRVAPEYARAASAALSVVAELQRAPHSKEGNADPAKKAEACERLYELVGHLTMHQTRFVRLSSAAEFEQVLHHARVCLQLQQSYGKPADSRECFELRDLYMAENIEYIAKVLEPEAKIAVWAHNGHVFTGRYIAGVPSMGERLRQLFGNEYYVLGFSFSDGHFQSRDMTEPDGPAPLIEFTLPPAREGTADWYLGKAGLDNYIIDFRNPRKPDAIARWLSTTLPMRSIGSGFASNLDPEKYEQVHPLSCYDGLVYVAHTTRARPTPTGIR